MTLLITEILGALASGLLVWGWLFLLLLALWVAWESYMFIKRIDFMSAIQWTHLQITVPEETAQTPKAMETAFEVWGGIHKNPDLIEQFFEGYSMAWFSCEIACSPGKVRYVMVVPTVHAKFFEGVVYGQYPTAEIKEVPDYTLEFDYRDIGKKFDIYGAEIVPVKDDFYPIRTYREFEDTLAEDDKIVDPHQALIEAYTNVNPGEYFWVQILVRPIDAGDIDAWAQQGQDRIAELSGQKKEEKTGLIRTVAGAILALPGELFSAFFSGPAEPADKKKEEREFHIYNPSEDAEMKGILQKVSRTGFKTKIRVIHIAPAGQMHKPNISKAIGAFKQFNSFHMNSLMPSGDSKTNGPNYILKQTRRAWRQKVILLNFQWRDFWGDKSGHMYTAEELATLYHFPMKYVRSPSVERATSGLASPPENLPYT